MDIKDAKRNDLKYILQELYNQIITNEDEGTALGVILYNKTTKILDFKYFIENDKWLNRFEKNIDDNEGLARRCVKNRETLIIDDYLNQWMDYVEKPIFDGEIMRSVYCTPIVVEGEVVAVFTVQNHLPGIFRGRIMDKVLLVKKVLEHFFYEKMERTLLEESKAEVENLLKQLSIVKEAGKAVVSTSSLRKIAHRVYTIVRENYSDCAIGVSINDRINHKITDCFLYELGELMEVIDIPYSRTNSLMVRTALSGEEIIREKVDREKALVLKGKYPKASYCTPLKMNDEIIGCFTYQLFHKDTFSQAELDLCRQLTPFMTIAVNNSLEKKKLMETNKILKEASERDHLTGLYNRRSFYELFEKAWMDSGSRGRPAHLLLLDFDNFKGVNDNFSHLHGDRALKSISTILSEEIPNNYAGRYGGDEFIAGFTGLSREEVMEIGDRIRERISRLKIPTEADLSSILTASIGILEAVPARPLREYLIEVDELLYLSKKQGKNRISFKSMQQG